MVDSDRDTSADSCQQGASDRPKRYRVWTEARGWEIYIPPKDAPVPFAIQHRGKHCLVYRIVSDAEYFAANSRTLVRFTIATGPGIDHFGNGYFTWRTVTRGGGVMEGDVYDLYARLRTFRHGTPRNRLRRAMRRIAVRDYCRIIEDSPDIVSAWRHHV